MLRFVPTAIASLILGGLVACTVPSQKAATVSDIPPVVAADHSSLLAESWTAYRKRFIQADGRVIDWEAKDRSTSEGQAYAMLRAVFADDPDTFAIALQWAENNLKRKKSQDSLWAWQWGRDSTGNWGILDQNVASDADIDAITALILASRRWQRPEYLTLARTKLKDLWNYATIAVPADRQRYLLPGSSAVFQREGKLKVNPSYLAPCAFRLFAQVDRERDWLSLVESSYQMLEQSSRVSSVGLPSDWIALDPKTGEYSLLDSGSPLVSRYGFDAFRVWWRVALDAAWFGEPRAKAYLQANLGFFKKLWQSDRKIPAQLDLQGRALVDYESTAQYGMLYAAFRVIDPAIAEEILVQKLLPPYQNGFWDHESAYYTQNLAWFGLMPQNAMAAYLLPPTQAANDVTQP